MLRFNADLAPRVELLRRVRLFADCSRAEMHWLAWRFREVHVPTGATIVEQGTRGDRFYILAEGMASVLVDEKKVASITPGRFFGEMALLDEGPRSATVTAELPCRLLVMDRDGFDAARAIPSVNDKVLREMAGRLRASNRATALT
jgi:CRP-like cAMP-binding protein